MTIALVQLPHISEGDVEVVAIDYTPYLDSGELLTGTPTATEQTTSDLTLLSVAVNTASLTILGNTAAIGAAVQFKVSGQLLATGEYSILVTAATDATIPRTKKVVAKFRVV